MSIHRGLREPLPPDGGGAGSISFGVARRDLLKVPFAAAAGLLAVPVLGGTSGASAAEPTDRVSIAPCYYPRKQFKAQIDLDGKLAVITGASRGIGRAIGDALVALGADVIGTSRDPARVPDPPSFPLLALDVGDPASVYAFVARLQADATFQQHGQVDILVNNAARFVAGQIVPLPPTDFSFYLAQRDLGLRTLYSGHVMLTTCMLPLMPWQGYSRVVFTVSIDAYMTGANLTKGLGDVYHAGKGALRVYANNLDAALRAAGSAIRVSTVNPYCVNTALATHPNPIYTQPVNSSGLSDTDGMFNAAATWLRQLLANGLPPGMAGEAYAQLLQMQEPEPNVVVASPHKPLATQGGNTLIEPEILAENVVSAGDSLLLRHHEHILVGSSILHRASEASRTASRSPLRQTPAEYLEAHERRLPHDRRDLLHLVAQLQLREDTVDTIDAQVRVVPRGPPSRAAAAAGGGDVVPGARLPRDLRVGLHADCELYAGRSWPPRPRPPRSTPGRGSDSGTARLDRIDSR